MEKKTAKLPFLRYERLSRLMTGFLLFVGLLLPMLFSLGAQRAWLPGLLLGTGLLVVFSLLGSFRHGRLYLLGFVAVAAGAQFLLPNKGIFGAGIEAVNAVRLYFSDVHTASAMFAVQISLLLGALLPILTYAFSSRLAGFLPATILTVLMLFMVCSLGQSQYLWLSAPAFVALLLLISQTSNENGNLYEVLPLAALVVALAMLILPAGQAIIKPLYEQAMELKQTIEDYLFFTDEREIFTIGQYGWYPLLENENRMGGEVTPAENPVMVVKTDEKTLLRGVSKDYYNGSTWENTVDMTRYLYVGRRWRSLRTQVFGMDLPDVSIRQMSTLMDEKAIQVQIQDNAASTLFAPVMLRSYSPSGNLVAYFNERGELFTTRNLARDNRYTVYAPVFEGGSTQLGNLIRTVQNAAKQNGDFYDTYLQLPTHLQDTFYSDVKNIVSAGGTDYDKACAIQRHLKRYYRYTLTPETAPVNQDFVTNFLYVTKEGYSVHFASAMTVMCRMAGIPARYVEGFRAVPSSDGFAYVTGKNAAAWCEIWVDGFGWIPFDMTPDQDDIPEPPPQNEDSPEPSPTPTPTPPPPESEDEPEPTPPPPASEDDPETTPTPPPEEPEPTPDDDPKNNEPPRPFPWWLLLVAALVAALAVRVAATRPRAVAKRAAEPADKVFVYGAAVTVLAGLRKLKPKPSETPVQYAQRVDQSRMMPAPCTPMFNMLSAARYGNRTLPPEGAAHAENTFAACLKAQSPLMKLRFLLKTAFTKDAYGLLTTHVVYEKPADPYDYGSITGKKAKRGKKAQRTKADEASFARPAGEPVPPMPTHTEEELSGQVPVIKARPVTESVRQDHIGFPKGDFTPDTGSFSVIPEDLPSFEAGPVNTAQSIAMGGVSAAEATHEMPVPASAEASAETTVVRRRRSRRPE